MRREIGGQVRKKLGGDRSEPQDVWDTATTEPPPGDLGEAPECAWCPVCRAARRIRESGPGLGSQLSGASDAVAAAVQEALRSFDGVLSRGGTGPGPERPRPAPSSNGAAATTATSATAAPAASAPTAPAAAAPETPAPETSAPEVPAPDESAPEVPAPDESAPGAASVWSVAVEDDDPAGSGAEGPGHEPDDRS